jgi:hypothetical protein
LGPPERATVDDKAEPHRLLASILRKPTLCVWSASYNAFMRLRAPLTCTLLAASPLALANGAMGLALEIFDFTVWWVYVGVIVVFEAWYIGRRLETSLFRSLVISISANLISAITCAGGCFAPFLHFAGPNPNPLKDTFLVLLVYGLASTFIEAFVWYLGTQREDKFDGGWKLAGKVLLAHLIGIPISMAVLLVPERPYPGFEAQARQNRWYRLSDTLSDAYLHVGADTPEGVDSQFKSMDELQAAILASQEDKGYAKVALCQPEFDRFDTGTGCKQRFKLEFNQEPANERTWLVKVHHPRDPDGTWYLDTYLSRRPRGDIEADEE